MRVEHGGDAAALAETLGYPLEECIDFSANINPFGLSEQLKSTLVSAMEQLTHYPDIYYRKARLALSEHHNCDLENLALSNGAVELFYELARYFRPKQVLTLSPTFMEYEKAFTQVGARVKECVLKAPDYHWDCENVLEAACDLSRGDVVLICNPNNPTGTLQDNQTLKKVAAALAEKGIILIIDEAFMDFLSEEETYSFIPYLAEFTNSIVVRSLTKFYAIPGLRLGYALSYHPTCLTEIQDKRAPWTVNTLADTAVPVIVADKVYQDKTRKWLVQEKEYLFHQLSQFSCLIPVKPSVNYLFFEYQGELDLREELRKYKIFIRSCSNYRQLSSQHYRVAIRSRKENERLLAALRTVLEDERLYD
ncbi:threonine-phosphate decarboxylase CobD [Streptococcus cuniculi]|uniref:threonine-phosphate decarboxylase n=1 Tax=Streptococcus cuniculi TaxID=1432788 RepID=A0A4Y9JCE3_9STRE|nr:threonine-phosphate decarboxylase CobD [Streptococcus cuniculi]MBF0777613.1 threonine-phosphate decarboxylase [Streptococcus cuniculi]TFU98653.1 threonine-phosphate decarboxylase [Streptococcus cuniculi]